jgi:aldose 1-epimerase
MKRDWVLGGAVLIGAVSLASTSLAAETSRRPFGATSDGAPVEAITLTSGHTKATIITFGASLQALETPDRNGKMADVVLGYPDMTGYSTAPSYFGATVGRVANRIAKGTFKLDGVTYHTPINNGPNTLHGGPGGFGDVIWQVIAVTRGASASVVLRYVSPDGDQGFPGKLTTTATYSLNDRGELSIDYRATTDRATVVNISNHAYWDLAGEGSSRGAMGHLLTIPADEYTPTDATAIPTGEFRRVAGGDFDFRTPHAIGQRLRDGKEEQLRFGRGYDHNWVLSRTAARAPRLTARVEDPVSGRVMEILSTQPGLQFYSGNFLDATIVGKSGRLYRQGDAIVLEPQALPDTPNQPSFGSIRLEPGQVYENHILYRFSTAPARNRTEAR